MSDKITKCPICGGTEFQVSHDPSRDMLIIMCPRCTRFKISEDAAIYYEETIKEITSSKAELSGLARHLTKSKQTLEIIADKVSEYLENPIIPRRDDIERKADLLLLHIKSKTNSFGQDVVIDLRNEASVCFAADEIETRALLRYLGESEFIEIRSDQSQNASVILRAKGYEHLRSTIDSKQIFIASWFHDDRDEYIAAIEQGIHDAGYAPKCIKYEHYSETVMDKAIGEIRRSRCAVVDLTGLRDSVLVEAGFAMGLGLDIIYVCDANAHPNFNELEFYVKHYKCSGYKSTEELRDLVESAIRARLVK